MIAIYCKAFFQKAHAFAAIRESFTGACVSQSFEWPIYLGSFGLPSWQTTASFPPGCITFEHFSEPKKGSKKQKSGRAGEDENDHESTSSEEEAVEAHSDTEIQYVTPWNETRTDMASIGAQQQNQEQQQEETKSRNENIKYHLNKSPTSVVFRRQSMKSVYGMNITFPSKKDMMKYERYAELGKAYYHGEQINKDQLEVGDPKSIISSKESFHYHTLHPLSIFTNDNSFGVEAPVVSESARQKYAIAVRCALEGPKSPSSIDLKIYAEYAQNYSSVVKGLRK